MFEKKQIVLLLVGGDTKQREEITEGLVNYGLSETYNIVDPLRELVGNSFEIDRGLFVGSNKEKGFKRAVIVNHKNLGPLFRNFRMMLPQSNRSFNPHTIGAGKVRIRPLTSPKQALLEVGNNFVHQFCPTFCADLTYVNLEGRAGLYVVEGVRTKEEIRLAKKAFQHVYVVGIPVKVSKEWLAYPTEMGLGKIKADFPFKKAKMAKQTKEMIEEIIEKTKKSPDFVPIVRQDDEGGVGEKSKMVDEVKKNGACVTGEKSSFVFEPKSFIPDHKDIVKW